MPKYRISVAVLFDSEVEIEAEDPYHAEKAMRDLHLEDFHDGAWGSISHINMMELEEITDESDNPV